jgi:hypothetical protein
MRRESVPNETPFVMSAWLVPAPVAFRIVCKSVVICRASISMKPEPFMPMVLRSLAMVWSVTNSPPADTCHQNRFADGHEVRFLATMLTEKNSHDDTAIRAACTRAAGKSRLEQDPDELEANACVRSSNA